MGIFLLFDRQVSAFHFHLFLGDEMGKGGIELGFGQQQSMEFGDMVALAVAEQGEEAVCCRPLALGTAVGGVGTAYVALAAVV